MQTKTSWSLTQSSQPDLCIFITPHIYEFKLWDLLLNQKKSAGKLQFFHIERHIMRTKSHANIPVVKFRSHHFCKFSKTFTWIDFDHVLHLFDVTGLETCSQLEFCSWHKQGQPVNNYQQQWHSVALPAQHHTSLLLHRRERCQHLLNSPLETVKVWPTSSIWNAFPFQFIFFVNFLLK